MHNLDFRTLSPRRARGLVEESVKERVALNLEPWGKADRAKALKALRSYGPRRVASTPAGRAYFYWVQERNIHSRGEKQHQQYTKKIAQARERIKSLGNPSAHMRISTHVAVLGSSLGNPWILQDNGGLIPPTLPPNVSKVMPLPREKEKHPYEGIIQGPPSSINVLLQPSSRINIISPRRATESAGPLRSNPAIRVARTKRAAGPAGGKRPCDSTPDPTRTPPHQYWRFGAGDNQPRRSQFSAVTRVVRKRPLPPVAHKRAKPHHECDICSNVSHCYDCARIWFDKKSKCPHCKGPVH
ncbi:hypothetical protein B0H13DRAFT_1904082 [Mycena leptocephala]|nr:hypothetical protein B0H13DRAFT_1904082 [Mycena leptocephala]